VDGKETQIIRPLSWTGRFAVCNPLTGATCRGEPCKRLAEFLEVIFCAVFLKFSSSVDARDRSQILD
jgi:hypothetical protein